MTLGLGGGVRGMVVSQPTYPSGNAEQHAAIMYLLVEVHVHVHLGKSGKPG